MAAKFPARAFAIAALLPLAAVAAGKATYKWVDAQGRTHFSDVPAPKSQVVDVKPGSNAVRAAPAEGDAAKSAAECQRRKDQLANYNAASEVRETDALGNTRTYTAEEKAKLIGRTQQQMEDACKAADGLKKPPPGSSGADTAAPPPAASASPNT